MRLVALLSLVALLLGCGGGGTTPRAADPNPNNSGGSTNGGNGATSLAVPLVVTVAQGQTVAGIDIAVPAPSASPAPNAQNLGVNPTSGPASASNTGGTIHRGASNRILLFGPGLTAGMTVRISGPSDIAVSNISGVQATDNTPGLAFIATANPNAALGARTVYLVNGSGDVTAFTGSLEVVP